MAVVAKTQAQVAPRALRPRHVLGPVVAALALALGLLGVEAAYAGRALPGLHVAGVPVGSLDAAQAARRIQMELAQPWAAAAVVLEHDGRRWTTTNGDIGIVPDTDAAARAAVAFGKSGNALDRARAWMSALRGDANIALAVRPADGRAQRLVAAIAAGIDRPAVDGALARGPEGLVVTEPVVGRETRQDAALAALLSPLTLGDRTIEVPVRLHHPSVDEAGFVGALNTARAITTPLEIRALDGVVVESAANLATLLVIERAPAAPGELPALPEGSVAPPARYRLAVSLDQARVARWVAAVAAILDRPAREASYAVQADGSLAVVPSQTGVLIDAERLLGSVGGELVLTSATVPRVITPSFVIDRPAFTTDEATRYLAQMRPIGTYTTHFPVNAARWANISTGARQFDGLVLAPGASFSFWELLGPVTVERGYRYSGAIIDGMSDDNVIGGGLCQVSTTLFNVVVRAGYQIDERHAHHYYIDRYPLGLDAAVFMSEWGRSDLRWTNDTAYPLVIRSWSTATSVSFQVVTVPTGRSVSFTAPTVRNVKDVAADQPADPAFPAGVKVLGRDTWVTRTVAEGGRTVHRDTFFSRYSPVWGGPAEAASTP